MRTRKEVAHPRRGMILLTVLWTIALLSALAMAAAVTFRGFAGVASVGRDRVQGDALLTAGLEVAAGNVTSLGDKPLTEREVTIDLSTGSVRAHFSDEGGRIDVGKAPAAVLTSLLRFVGAPQQDAEAVAQRIAEWRRRLEAPPADAGSGPPNGGGSLRGQAANAGAGPPNGSAKKPDEQQPFADLRDLAQVPGMAPGWLAAMAPLTTVFGSETVNPLTASARVIAALPGVNRVQLEAFLAQRRSSPADAERLIAMFGSGQSYLAAKPQRVVAVELAAALPDGYGAAAHAIIVVLPQDSQPYRVLVWKPLPPLEERFAARDGAY
jgi:general secretion pathway protein K